MTKEEYEKWYAERTDTTAEHLRELGLQVVVCECQQATCRGYRIVHTAVTAND